MVFFTCGVFGCCTWFVWFGVCGCFDAAWFSFRFVVNCMLFDVLRVVSLCFVYALLGLLLVTLLV